MVYYNENDKNLAQWLRNLMGAGLIAVGEVDERSVEDVRPVDLRGFTQCHFFSGIGTWSYALRLAGWLDERPAWTGSCPCQPFSSAGKRKGVADERHLWPAWFWLIDQCRPPVVMGEQVSSKDGLAWLDLVLSDLEGAGYSAGACIAPACSVGAPHIRQRLWFVAESNGARLQGGPGPTKDERKAVTPPGATNGFWSDAEWVPCRDGKARPVKSGISPLAHGAPERVLRLRAYGNAICAPLAIEVIQAYMETQHE